MTLPARSPAHMANMNRTAISTLNSLIETCNDGAQGFQTAAEGIQDLSIRELFNSYARQRREFAEQLRAEVRRLGGTPDEGGSVSGSVHRGWMNLKAAIAGKTDSAIISEAERGEDIAVAAYQQAMSGSLPAEVDAIVRSQFSDVKAAHDRVRALELTHSR
jgi:uncharacterized protein (TIGR02284 family)